ncbi:MAG: carbohydrate-binding family 9-like protein [Planctomycetota bacterium]|nr:MAG: carbohydrate-binding family 9-like protein [Planctomycetota bacterium]
MKYMVNRFEGNMVLDGNWEGPAWSNVKPIALSYFMGDRPEHFPRTQAKLLYDDKFIHVIFRVEDRYVRAVAQKHQGMVCRDSCVEFFFTPGTDVKAGYFNLEMNCGGTMLFHFQVIPRKGREIEAADLARIEIAHQMPKIVDPEISKPTTWTVQYRLPIDILEKYYPGAKKPRSGISWRANFFKCADATSHPHWLTWSKVDRRKPDFHVPECFGILEFK